MASLKDQLESLTEARTALCLTRGAKGVFWACLVLRLRPVSDERIETMATDGTHLFYNPVWVCALTIPERVGVLAHEAAHVAFKHHTRMGDRNPERWNVACDLAINPLLRESGFTLPDGAIYPCRYALASNLAAEEYYELLRQEEEQQQKQGDEGKEEGEGQEQGGQGQGQGKGKEPGQEPGDGEGEGEGEGEGSEGPPNARPKDPGGCGGVVPPQDSSPAGLRAAEAQAEVAVRQAETAARLKGDLPGELERLIGAATQSVTDWAEELRDFLTRASRDDHSWTRPNRRFIHQGIYLPSLYSERLGVIAVAVDTSGSISHRDLERFAGEISAVVQLNPTKVVIAYHDTNVKRVQEWTPDDGPLTLEARGGGGTSHVCVFEWLSTLTEEVACLVCLTDLYTSFPDDVPEVPVLWAVTGNACPEAPFGKIVRIDP